MAAPHTTTFTEGGTRTRNKRGRHEIGPPVVWFGCCAANRAGGVSVRRGQWLLPVRADSAGDGEGYEVIKPRPPLLVPQVRVEVGPTAIPGGFFGQAHLVDSGPSHSRSTPRGSPTPCRRPSPEWRRRAVRPCSSLSFERCPAASPRPCWRPSMGLATVDAVCLAWPGTGDRLRRLCDSRAAGFRRSKTYQRNV